MVRSRNGVPTLELLNLFCGALGRACSVGVAMSRASAEPVRASVERAKTDRKEQNQLSIENSSPMNLLCHRPAV